MSEYPLFGVDYSFYRPDLTWLWDQGVRWVYRYLHSGAGAGAALTPAEYASLRAHGFPVVLGYEETGKELLGGFAAGVRCAQAAEALRIAVGAPAQPLVLNADFGTTPAQQAVINDAMRGAASVIGFNRTALYGGYYTIKAAFDAGVIKYGMQTYAWSRATPGGPVQWDPRAQIQQYNNGQWNGEVDFDRAMVPDFGQNPVAVPTGGDPKPIDPTQPTRKKENTMFAAYRDTNGTIAVQSRPGGALTLLSDPLVWQGLAAATGTEYAQTDTLDALRAEFAEVPYPLFDTGAAPISILAPDDGSAARYGEMGGRAWELTTIAQLQALENIGAAVKILPAANITAILDPRVK